MPILPFGDFRPDVSDYEGMASQAVNNVIPRGDGYGPWPALLALSSALPGPCRGYFYGRKTDGSVQLFAATSTKLYALNNTTFAWSDVSKGGASYSAVSGTAQWQFAQFGNFIVAVQANVVAQVYDLTSSSAFADLGGSPPQAGYVAVVGQFLVLSGLASLPYRIQWSGLNAITTWTAGVNSSDFQDFPDGGTVLGVAGGEYGVIFQNTTIRQMVYAPGSSYIFQITRLAEDQGLYAPYAIVRAGPNIFFPSAQGFQKLVPGATQPVPIGEERVNRRFFADVDAGNLQLLIGANDPNGPRVFWAYKSINGASGLFDTLLCYDYVLDRFSRLSVSGQYMATAAKPGVTLEQLDNIATGFITISGAADNGSGKVRLTVSTIALPTLPTPSDGASVPTQLTTGTKVSISGVGGTTEANGENIAITVIDSTTIDLPSIAFVHAYTSGGIIGGPLDAMTVSLDSYPNASASALAAFDANNNLGFFNGANLEATMESAEKGDIGKRIFVSGFRPVTDAPSCYGSVSSRENLQATRVYSTENVINRQGFIPARVSTRYARGKVRIPSGTSWTFALGIEPEAMDDGVR